MSKQHVGPDEDRWYLEPRQSDAYKGGILYVLWHRIDGYYDPDTDTVERYPAGGHKYAIVTSFGRPGLLELKKLMASVPEE